MTDVFVVRRAQFFGGAWPQGFVPLGPSHGRGLLQDLRRHGLFLDRRRAERDPAFKQLIPYCVLTRGTEIFVVKRHAEQSEARLHGLLSIGLGGHIEPADGVGGDLFATALRRELAEEITFPTSAPAEPRFLGILNDDRSEVGRVHAGLVYRLDLPTTAEGGVGVREVRKMSGGFAALPPAEGASQAVLRPGSTRLAEWPGLWQDPARFESWSRMLLEAGHPVRSGPGCLIESVSDRISVRGETRREESHDGREQNRIEANS